ncbi:TetR/AcrR family transcriptional regulator [Streptomyces sp. 4N509B]|uniref:TetR/AcrR family transcriptional regulator n=1 Tax=Streptomyces sp. 4N509B TaxID=3457413 RepID=UPI003FD50F78
MASTATGRTGKRRADAERNIAAIIDAALDCFRSDPHAGMAAIARAAGVSRVTLYTHFPTREAVLDAVMDRAMAQTSAVLNAEGLRALPADEALVALARTSWRILDRHLGLFTAVSATLTPEQLRDRHHRVLTPLRGLLERGQEQGAIRADLPAEWLVSVYYHLVHAAAADVQAGRLRADDVAEVLAATLLPTVRPLPS